MKKKPTKIKIKKSCISLTNKSKFVYISGEYLKHIEIFYQFHTAQMKHFLLSKMRCFTYSTLHRRQTFIKPQRDITISHYTERHFTISHYTERHFTISHYTETFYHFTLHRETFYHFTLHRETFYHFTLHRETFHITQTTNLSALNVFLFHHFLCKISAL
jgi:hypothetical protein